MRCTRTGERRSFYRQVFDHGNEPVPGDGLANSDFGRLWKILMLESARYLERAQTSPNPDSFVSRQNVMQAVEDLQYNLSTSCVGMATVMTPLMYAELDFVVDRILGHPEVRKHLVPSGGSWWQVVEKLQAGQGRRARATVLNNKARIGYALVAVDRDVRALAVRAGRAVLGVHLQRRRLHHHPVHPPGGGRRPERRHRRLERAARGRGRVRRGLDARLPGDARPLELPGMPSIPGVSAPWPGAPGGTTASNGSSRSYGANGGYGSNGTNGYPAPTGQPSVTGSSGGGSADSGDWDF